MSYVNTLSLKHKMERREVMRSQWFVLSLIVVVLFGLSSTAHGSIQDQGQIFGTDGALDLETAEWSQSITTGISGLLTGIMIQFHYGIPVDPPTLNLSIFSGGNPISGSALFSEQLIITSIDLDNDNLFTWDLSSAGLLFNVGDVFSFVLQAEEVGYNIAGNDYPGYEGGELFGDKVVFPGLNDIGFITFVTPLATTNGGFEVGDGSFFGWETIGDTSIQNGNFGSGPTEGNFQALITTAGAGDKDSENPNLKTPFSEKYSVPADELVEFLGLSLNDLISICPSCGEGKSPNEGSAIRGTFFANAGDMISFDFNFLTDEVCDEECADDEELEGINGFFPDVNDFAFVMINPVKLEGLADVYSSPLIPSLTAFLAEDGFSTFSFTVPNAGAYTIAVGVVDQGDDVVISGVLIDNFSLSIVMSIDVKPGSGRNAINPGSKGVIPIAILSTDTFDAQTVDPETVHFGPAQATVAHALGHAEDVDDDGDLDLVVHFPTQQTGISCGDTSVTLTGQTFAGVSVMGSDQIVTVGCK